MKLVPKKKMPTFLVTSKFELPTGRKDMKKLTSFVCVSCGEVAHRFEIPDDTT